MKHAPFAAGAYVERFDHAGYPIQESGSLRLTAAPELSTWAMMLLGFAGIGFAGYRASRRTTAVGLRA